jgi:hypothetical protein
MSDAAAPTSTTAKPAGIARRLVGSAAGIDDWTHRWCRNRALGRSEKVLPYLLIAIGSALIWSASQAASQTTRALNGFVCAVPGLDGWSLLNCAQALRLGAAGWLVLYVVFLVGLSWLLGRLFVSFSSRIVLSWLDRVEPGDIPCKVVIVGLSSLPPGATSEQAIAEARQWTERWRLYAGPAAQWKKEKAAAGEPSPARAGGWQQAARMIAVHLAAGRLEKIYVLPSGETLRLFEDFKTYLETLFATRLDIRLVAGADGKPFEDATAPAGRGRSYDNYTYLRDGLAQAVAMAKHDLPRLRDGTICLDATAGFKLFSIAAAVVTLDRNVLLGYVVTGGGGTDNAEEGVVKLYDPRIEFLGAVRNRLAQSAIQGGG